MKQFNFKALMPHLIAIIIFLLVAVIFCKPSLEADTVLKQGDIIGWQGMSHQSFEYKEKHGHFPLWVTSMFCGMPGYQIALEGAWSPLSIIDKVIQLYLPQPLNFFFLACISFYFLCICLKVRPYAAILGALAFAYCSFSPIIIAAGHNTQMFALAYAPSVIGAAILIFDKKYLTGFALTALLTALQIGQGHQQISYYLFLILAAMTIAFAIQLIRKGEVAHLLKSLGLMLFAGLIGVASNALVLMTTYDYSKESKRGGQLVIGKSSNEKDAVSSGKTKGLSKDYAFMWSYGKSETWSLMFPGVNGYGSYYTERDGEPYLFPKLTEDSHVAKYLIEKVNAPEDQAVNFAFQQSQAIYWGGQPGTNGAIYLGAVICFLFLFGMFYLDGRHKWWILAICVFAVLLAWGDHLPGFNYFMFDHFPLYNKFRVPTMTLVIPQILFPVIAVLVVEKLLQQQDKNVLRKFKFGTFAVIAAFLLISVYYISSDFSKENKARTTAFNTAFAAGGADMETALANLDQQYKGLTDNRLYEGMAFNLKDDPNAQKSAREFVSALRKDRAGFLLKDILRALAFVLLAWILIALFLRQKINGMIMLGGVTILATIDLLGFSTKYLNEKSYDSKERYEATEFPITAADKQIMDDKDPNFRVFNTSSLEESKTSYYHKSIGGYHPAKIGIYDDLMTYQLNGSPNVSVVNMLNAKYIIQRQGKEQVAMKNPEALGNAWFVKAVKWVNGPVEEMKALDNFTPRDTAIIDASFKTNVGAYSPADSAASIRLTSFDNDALEYESSANGNHIALFSEIYYKDWKAYIDGKPAPIVKANYVLRALNIPAGKHKISFKFEPAVFYTGRNIANISTWIMMLLVIAALFMAWKKRDVAGTGIINSGKPKNS
jgi:hypothetical protein